MFSCKNTDLGCNFVNRNAADLQHHENGCLFFCVTCTHCSKNFLQINESIHRQICRDFPLECSRCKSQIPRKDFERHAVSECPFSIIVACEACHETTNLGHLASHKNQCSEFVVSCECGSQFKRKMKDYHSLLECTFKMLSKSKSDFNVECSALKSCIQGLKKRESGATSYITMNCSLCGNITCDIFSKNCSGCRLKFCKDCAIKIFKTCKKCGAKFCESCNLHFMESESCLNCRPLYFTKALADFKKFKII